MQLIKEIFNDRKREIDLYFDLINFLDSIDRQTETNLTDSILYNRDIEKIIKANSLLMMYNLIESTLTNSIEKVYSILKEDNITYSQVRQEIQNIWFNYKFSNAHDKNSHFYTYRDTAEKIINSIMQREPLELNRKATGISGNLDADTIRQICKTHGIQFRTPENCHGGQKLSQVKDQRNLLAHGTLSFVECGRDFSISDLHETKIEVETFLQEFINAIEKYYNEKEYLSSNINI